MCCSGQKEEYDRSIDSFQKLLTYLNRDKVMNFIEIEYVQEMINIEVKNYSCKINWILDRSNVKSYKTCVYCGLYCVDCDYLIPKGRDYGCPQGYQ